MKYKGENTPTVLRPIDDLELPDMVLLPLRNADIYYIGDLIIRTERQLLAIPGFTDDCLTDIKELLKARGLSLETRLEHWPPTGWRRDK